MRNVTNVSAGLPLELLSLLLVRKTHHQRRLRCLLLLGKIYRMASLYPRICHLLFSLISPSSLTLLMVLENLLRDDWKQSPACLESPTEGEPLLESWGSRSIRLEKFK